MNSRYLTNVLLAIAGAFVVVASQAFSVAAFQWLMFGGGIVAVLLAGAIVLRERGDAQRGLDAVTGALGAWTIVASLVFAGTAVTWLGFASGAGLFALALAGLTLHELLTERVVHMIELRSEAAAPEFAGIR